MEVLNMNQDDNTSDSVSCSTNADIDPILEKQWLLATATCNYESLASILRQDERLKNYKSFINGYSGLHWAAKFGNNEIVRLLVGTYKSDLNIRDSNGMTPLHLTYLFGRSETRDCIQGLYDGKNIRDYAGRYPQEYSNIPGYGDRASVEVRQRNITNRKDNKNVYTNSVNKRSTIASHVAQLRDTSYAIKLRNSQLLNSTSPLSTAMPWNEKQGGKSPSTCYGKERPSSSNMHFDEVAVNEFTAGAGSSSSLIDNNVVGDTVDISKKQSSFYQNKKQHKNTESKLSINRIQSFFKSHKSTNNRNINDNVAGGKKKSLPQKKNMEQNSKVDETNTDVLTMDNKLLVAKVDGDEQVAESDVLKKIEE